MASTAGQVLTFRAGGRSLALPTGAVAEVLPLPPSTRVPLAPRSLKGVANVRGKAAPIVSLGALLGEAEGGSERRVIVLQGREPIGLAVERVDDVGEPSGEATLIDPAALLAEAFAGWRGRRAAARAAPLAAEASSPVRVLSFLEFMLAGQAYALPLEQVREVFTLDRDVVPIAGVEPLMLGAAEYRGALLPIISLRGLLGLAVEPAMQGATVIVASLGKNDVGLLVDRPRGVLRASESQIGPVPAVLNRGDGEARIDAIVRTGQGLVSVLAPERIFSEETVAAVLAETCAAETVEVAGAEPEERIVEFRVGEERYGLPVAAVAEVIPMPSAITPVPKAPPFLLGVVNQRGRVLPLIDQARRFSAMTGAARRQVIVCSLGSTVAGLVVDAVEQVRAVSEHALRAAPELTAAHTPLFDRVLLLELADQPLLVIDPKRLLAEAEQDLLLAVASSGQAASS